MVGANWKKMIEDITKAALGVYFQKGDNRSIVSELLRAGEDGLSFSELKIKTGMNSSSLQRRLKSLVKGGVIENFLKKSEETRYYSQYNLTRIGEIVYNEVETFSALLESNIELKLELSSRLPEVRELAGNHFFLSRDKQFDHLPYVILNVRNWGDESSYSPGRRISIDDWAENHSKDLDVGWIRGTTGVPVRMAMEGAQS